MVDYPSFITSLEATSIKGLINTETKRIKYQYKMAKRQGLFVLFNQRPINIFWKEVFASWLQIDDEMLLYETQFFLVGYK